MNLEDQVCSLDLAIKLKHEKIEQNSLFYWIKDIKEWLLTAVITENDKMYFQHLTLDILPIEYYSAFTVAELGNILQNHSKLKLGYQTVIDINEFWFCNNDIYSIGDKIEANARAKWILHLLGVK